jgi:tetratricopeptide (TPR) repeat protein
MKSIYVLVCFLFFSIFSFGQVSSVDSLLGILKMAKEDTVKVNTLNELFLEYEFSDSAKAQECLNKAFELSNQADFKKGLASTYINLGYFAEDKGDFPVALKNYEISLKTFEIIGDKEGISDSYNNMGNVYIS